MLKSTWSTLLLIREAVRNVFGTRSRIFVLVLASVTVGSAVAVFSASEAQGLLREIRGLEADGARVVSFGASSSRDTVTIDRASCEGLTTMTGVERAGIIVPDGSRDIPELGARIDVYSASTTLFPGLRTADGVRGSALAPRSRQSDVTLGHNDIRRLAPAAVQPEGIPTNRGLVFPLAPTVESASSCVAVLSRFAPVASLSATLAAQLDATGGQVGVVRILTPTTDPIERWHDRPGQYLALLAGLLGGLATSLLSWTRSSEIAAYRLSGTRRPALATLLTLESLLLGGVFATAGSAAVIVLRGEYLSVVEQILWLIAGGACWILSASLGVIRSTVVSPATLARER